MGIRQAVANHLILLCGEQDIAIHQLAIRSGVSPSTVKNIIYGKSKNPGITTIKKLCDGLNVPIGDFFSAPEFAKLEQEIK